MKNGYEHSSTAPDSGNADYNYLRASLNKPLPALPHPYFEYLFADAGVEGKLGKKTSKRSLEATETPRYAFIDSERMPPHMFVKSAKTKSSDFVKPASANNPYIEPLKKRDSDGFFKPTVPASAYPNVARAGNSIDNLSFQKEDEDTGLCLRPRVPMPC